MERYVVVDLETTGHLSNNDKIIEVGIVIIEDDRIVDEYGTLLNPGKPIPAFIESLTGISDKDVESAPVFSDIRNTILDLIDNGYIIAHNVPFDLGFLNAELAAAGSKPLTNPVLDTVELARIFLPQAPSYKLGHLAEYLEISHHAPHRAISDAHVTARLFLMLKQKLKQLPYETIHHLLKLEPLLQSDLSHLLVKQKEKLSFSLSENENIIVHRGLAFRKIAVFERTIEEVEASFGAFLDATYEAGGTMQQQMDNYEKRDGQREMSETVYDAFQSDKHALIEAETGTGKSIAYLLPAIYEAVTSQKRIIISTHTTQLQTQLLEEEIPFLKKLVPFSFHAVLLKGKYHYISLEKFEKELTNGQNDNYDVALTKAMILVWLTETKTGDIDEIHLPSSGYFFYKRISTEAEGMADPQSPWFSHSYYQKARKKAQWADIIITNHALLCTDMFNDYAFLPAYERAIIDEAHHLEETTSHHYGLKLDYVHLLNSLNQIGTTNDHWFIRLFQQHPDMHTQMPADKWDALFNDAKYETDELFRAIFQYVAELQKQKKTFSDVGRWQYRFDKNDEMNKEWQLIKDMAGRLTFFLRDLIHMLTLMEREDLDHGVKDEIMNNVNLLQQFIDQLEHFFLLEDDSSIKWIEIDAGGAKNAVYLYSEPADVSSLLKELFFAEKKSIILTSATLTMKKSFSFMEKRLGIPENRLLKKQIQSPFTYREQVQLLVPNDFPDLKYGNMDDFIYSTCEAILSLAEITNGRMLILFTSYDMLRKSYYLLKEIMETEEYVLIAQGISSGSRSRLKKNFETFDKAILLGTSSFWEGVDIPGEALSCLVIARLPFQPPDHPLHEAKALLLKQEGLNAFFELSLPNAVIRFKQGFGRLIRSENDRGIVFVCDARIVKARYGKYFIDSIPDVPLLYDSTNVLMEKAKSWF